jgi:hypothetical protein
MVQAMTKYVMEKHTDTGKSGGLVLARREALAWGYSDHGHGAHRRSGEARRGCLLDGKGRRRTLPGRLEVSYGRRATV